MAFSRLRFEDPVMILPDPHGGRPYVGSRQGIVWSIADDPNAATKSVFLDLRPRCQGFDDGGLLALAFHPRFGQAGAAERGQVYIFYNYSASPAPGPERPPTTPPTRDRLSRLKPPIHKYSHREGSAVIGGYVYRGPEHVASLGGMYVLGDNGGRIGAMTYDGKAPPRVESLCDLPMAPSRSYGLGLSSFGEGRDGELYLCQLGHEGRIYRLARTGPAVGTLPRTLGKTGAFRDLKTLDPAAGLVAYDVNSPLWSDGAAKSRWVAVPNDGPPYAPGERVGFAASGPLSFPDGTVVVKHFELSTGPVRRRLETRFLVRSAGGGAYGLTYRCRPDGADADLFDDGADEVIAVNTAGGTGFRPGTSPAAAIA